jgi:hypothetical protein
MRLSACGDTTNVAASLEQLTRTTRDGPYADSDDAPASFSKQHLPSENRRRRDKHCHTGVTTRREFRDSTGNGLRRLSLVRLLQKSLRHSRIRPQSDSGSNGFRLIRRPSVLVPGGGMRGQRIAKPVENVFTSQAPRSGPVRHTRSVIGASVASYRCLVTV